MKVPLKAFPLTLLFLFVSANLLFGQAKQADVDSAFQAYMNHAWTEIEKSNFSDTLQNKFAADFFKYFISHSETKTAFRAGREAFMMWGNTGAADEAEAAMAKLDYNSRIWSTIINSISNAYSRNGEKAYQNFIALLKELREKLTHPQSQSAVLLQLAQIYHRDKKFEKVKGLAQEIIELDAEKFHTDQARGLLYEIKFLSIGKKAPDFQAKTIEGETVSLSNLKGKIILLDFWAMWCGPCIPEIPHIKSIRSDHSEEELQIVGISLDENVEKLNQFINEREMNWPHIIQPESWKDEITKLYNISRIPQTYIINREGIIVAKDLRGEKLEKKIAELLNKK
ncbi:MAG TPA: TlpA disulfide reductase family protein [Balneolaceae bacterium]